MPAHDRMWKDGIISGLLGAGGVAVWFLAVDLFAGRPFFTPALLGKALLSVLGRGIENHSMLFFVVAYTVFHVVAFTVTGCVTSALMVISRSAPQVAAGVAFFFLVFEVGFYFLALFLSGREVLGALAWYQIGAANLVAAALTGGYLLRRHPEFAANLDHALKGSV
jgi:hypothetical protein